MQTAIASSSITAELGLQHDVSRVFGEAAAKDTHEQEPEEEREAEAQVQALVSASPRPRWADQSDEELAEGPAPYPCV